MLSSKFIGMGALAAASALAFALAAPAFAQLQPAPDARPLPPASTAGQPVTNLKPIRVQVYLPVALHRIKTALRQPVSFANKDMDKLVCRRTQHTGSHLLRLRCATNCQLWVQSYNTQNALFNLEATHGQSFDGVGGRNGSGGVATQMCDGPDGSASVNPSAQYAQARAIALLANRSSALGRASTLLGMVAREPAGSSYTLLVHDHGKVVGEFVVKHGKVVKIVKLKKTHPNKQ